MFECNSLIKSIVNGFSTKQGPVGVKMLFLKGIMAKPQHKRDWPENAKALCVFLQNRETFQDIR